MNAAERTGWTSLKKSLRDVVDRRGWLPEHVAPLTTQHRHPVQTESDGDTAVGWDVTWSSDNVCYSTVAGLTGLERAATVLAVDGFHAGLDPPNVLQAGMSRARDLLLVVGSPDVIAEAGNAKPLKRLQRHSQ